MKVSIVDLGVAGGLLVSAASHAYLYLHGYHHIPVVGPGFLLVAATFGALGVLIAAGGPRWLHTMAFAGAFGSLVAFGLSRTTGLFGFSERGFEPAPHAMISLIAEAAVAGLTLWSWRASLAQRRKVR